MDKKMKFKYFYGAEADQFSFYRIPKALFTDSYFKDLSSDAKILYGLMLDRMSLSIKNQWFDENNRAYIYFSIEDIMELLNCGRNKAIKSMQEESENAGKYTGNDNFSRVVCYFIFCHHYFVFHVNKRERGNGKDHAICHELQCMDRKCGCFRRSGCD